MRMYEFVFPPYIIGTLFFMSSPGVVSFNFHSNLKFCSFDKSYSCMFFPFLSFIFCNITLEKSMLAVVSTIENALCFTMCSMKNQVFIPTDILLGGKGIITVFRMALRIKVGGL